MSLKLDKCNIADLSFDAKIYELRVTYPYYDARFIVSPWCLTLHHSISSISDVISIAIYPWLSMGNSLLPQTLTRCHSCISDSNGNSHITTTWKFLYTCTHYVWMYIDTNTDWNWILRGDRNHSVSWEVWSSHRYDSGNSGLMGIA
jgi:hypothetical protein